MMVSNMKISVAALAALAGLLSGCGKTSSPAAPSSDQPKDTTSAYPNATLRIKSATKEVEVGGHITFRATVSGDVEEMAAVFESLDTSIFTVKTNSTGTQCEVTGVKAGTAKLRISVKENPTIFRELPITVVPAKPDLQTAWKNIVSLKNYTFSGGIDKGEGTTFTPSTITKVVDGTILTYNSKKEAVATEMIDSLTEVKYFGATVLEGSNQAVYLSEKRGKAVLTDAPLVRGGFGFVDKENLTGYATEAIGVDDTPMIYGLRAINPNWLPSEKNADNTYEIEGGTTDDKGLSTDHPAALVETLLWRLVDAESYNREVSALQDNFCTDVAKDVKTTITVTGPNTLQVNIRIGKTDYKGILSDVGTTTLDNDDVFARFASLKGTNTLIASDLQDGINALNTHNYILNNFMYPDHKTEFHYNTYFTPKYVFRDCSAQFKEEYNQKVTDPADRWTKDPYGFAKKADGIYQFTYHASENSGDPGTITWNDTKEEGTDAATDLYKFCYIEGQDFLSEPLVYAFSESEKTIWSNESTSYHETRSSVIAKSIIRFYDPADLPEYFDKAIAGIGVEYESDQTTVKSVDISAGFAPFIDDSVESNHTYGVDRFTISGFNTATANDVDALLHLD